MTADTRIEAILDVILALARFELDRRAPISDELDAIDGLATGVNLLADELETSTASRKELAAAYRNLKQAEAKLLHASKLAAIGQLASTVAHEINNPTAFVRANQHMILEHLEAIRQALPPALLAEIGPRLADATEMLHDNEEGVERICSIVRDLRTFSCIDHAAIGEVSLDEVVKTTLSLVHHELRHRARLVEDLGAVPAIVGDGGRLGQLVTNLLLNAAQSIPEGHADGNEVRVETRATEDHVVLVVADTGSGIPAELRERIFEPFFTTKPALEGTGLGLSLVAEIVRAHGGTISVDSSVGRGSRFEVRLPIQSTFVRPPPAEPESAPRSARRKRVLVIDDDARILDVFRRMLQKDHDVVLAHGGARALALLESDRAFDVILCALVMPEIDGPMIHAALLDREPELVDRLVFCTGGAFSPRARDFLAGGNRTILEKPFTPRALRDVIGRTSTTA